MQNRAVREYAARSSWTIALQVREVSSGAVKREVRERLLTESSGSLISELVATHSIYAVPRKHLVG